MSQPQRGLMRLFVVVAIDVTRERGAFMLLKHLTMVTPAKVYTVVYGIYSSLLERSKRIDSTSFCFSRLRSAHITPECCQVQHQAHMICQA